MRGRSRFAAVASFAAMALLVSACGGGGEEVGGNEPDQPEGKQGGEAVIKGCTPKTLPLVPGNTSETCGGNMIDAMTAKLVHYNTDTAEPEMDIAESIDTTDNQNFTVKLKKGYKFHDGTEVKAHNFVDAWNYTAAAKNAQAGSYFMGAIEGAAEISAEGATGEEMSGLKVVDDYTFTIKTTEKVSNLPVRLGYSAFAPLPDSFFANPDSFKDKPIGAGPFMVESISTKDFVFVKFPDYSGDNPASLDKLTFRVYDDDAAAYTDVVAGNLDFTDNIPKDMLVGDQYQADLPERNMVKETLRFAAVVFSPDDPQLKDNADLRKAISMAVDRKQIAETIFSNSWVPAHGWAPKVVDGANDTACGEACDFNADKAKELYEKSGGYDGTLTLTVNGDGDHKTWADATCNSIKNTLGVDCVTQVTPNFETFQKKIDAGELKGMFRSGWQGDYPSIENFLGPIYSKGADSNWSKYDNPEFEKKLQEAAAAPDLEEANKLYAEAEDILGQDLPAMPMWYPSTVVGWSDKVTNVKVNAFGVLDYSAIQVR